MQVRGYPSCTSWWRTSEGWLASVPGDLILLLVEHLHEVAGRFLIQPGGQGGGPEAVAAEPAAQPGERLDVCQAVACRCLSRMARAPTR